MGRTRHPKSPIEDALSYAETHRWVVTKSNARAHVWGVMRCPGDCRQVSIFSTPRSPEMHGKRLREAVDKCIH